MTAPQVEPLHAMVSGRLRTEIDAERLGGLLPSENELMQMFSVSRSVVRQALSTLEQEGLITKVRGKGSLVRPRGRVHRVVQSLNGLGMHLLEQGRPQRTQVLAYETGPREGTPPEWEAHDALYVERLRSSMGTPLALIRTILPRWIADVISRDDLEDGSLHALLKERAGVTLERSRRNILAVPASSETARVLGCSVGSPLLVLEGRTFDTQGRIIEVFTTYHRGDAVAFDVDTTA